MLCETAQATFWSNCIGEVHQIGSCRKSYSSGKVFFYMPESADVILENAEVHSLTRPDKVSEAVVLTNGEIIFVGPDSVAGEFDGDGTLVFDLDGRVVLPGFIDAHSHLDVTGRYVRYADLRLATSIDEYLGIIRESRNERDDEWIVGYDRNTWKKKDLDTDFAVGFDFDSRIWEENNQIRVTRSHLDQVSSERPVVVFLDTLQSALVNTVAQDKLGELVSGDVQYDDGGKTSGVIVGDSVDVLHKLIEPGPEQVRNVLLHAQSYAHSQGVTSVHDFVRKSLTPEIYRKLDNSDELQLRVRLNYWVHHLAELIDIGMQTNHGSDFVQMGGVKMGIDGSLGGGTARLSAPYKDPPDQDSEYRGTWRISEDEFRNYVRKIDDKDFQITVHSMGDEGTRAVLTAYEEETVDPGLSRHRIEHAEILSSEFIDRFAESNIVASMQPNFLKWMDAGGLYDQRLGSARRQSANPFPALLEAGVPLAFGSDKMPFGPLFGIHHVVNAPTDNQRLSVTEALRAYTYGGAYAGFNEDLVGTIEEGKKADIIALDRSPWRHPENITNISVDLTIIDGNIVYKNI